MSDFPLFQAFPELERHFPRVVLTRLPTRVHRLENLGKQLGTQKLWMKRDDESGLRYGGNKPRKLEFLLGEAVQRDAKTIITFGALGTNHGLATAFYAKRHGLRCVLVLVEQPPNDKMLNHLQMMHHLGAELVYAGNSVGAGVFGAFQFVKQWIVQKGELPYLIMPGGSTPLGALGYVNAAFELAAQIEAGELPMPDRMYIPVGSNGSMAGLALGCRLAGITSDVVGVLVADYPTINSTGLAKLGNQCWRMMRKKVSSIPKGKLKKRDILTIKDQMGKGYAHFTPEGTQAIQSLKECEGIELEGVYSGKALAGLFKDIKEKDNRKKNILFWNTYNSMPVSDFLPPREEYTELPKAFHRYFEEPELLR